MSLLRHRKKYREVYAGILLCATVYAGLRWFRVYQARSGRDYDTFDRYVFEHPPIIEANKYPKDESTEDPAVDRPTPVHLYVGPDSDPLPLKGYFDNDETKDTCTRQVVSRVSQVAAHWSSVKHPDLTAEDHEFVHRMMDNQRYKMKEEKDFCRHFLEFGRLRHRVIPYAWKASNITTDVITFVTQLSDTRFESLEHIIKHWHGAITAAVYLHATDVLTFIDTLCESSILKARENVDIHLVIKTGDLYPINYLRNVALTLTTTPLAFLSDVDFIPSSETVGNVENIYTNDRTFFDHSVLIVPAFEVNFPMNEVSYPTDKGSMMQLWKDGKIKPARVDKWTKGHMPTKYHTWASADTLYEVAYKPEYEPYIVMRTDRVPAYFDSFVERYRDKCQHIMEVAAMGFHFYVMPQTFTLHYPHSRSEQSSSKHLFRCARDIYKMFEKYIREKYHEE